MSIRFIQNKVFLRMTLAVLSLSLGFPSNSFSAEFPLSYQKEEAQIPKTPSAPPPLPQKAPHFRSHCERYFLYQGKKKECDSELGRDALNLSKLLDEVPAARAEMDLYRENQNRMRIGAYVGTAGILSIIAGVIISHPLMDPTSGSIRPGGLVALAGILVSANSIIYGLSMIRANETHLNRAVDFYNAARPSQPIELEFSTHLDF